MNAILNTAISPFVPILRRSGLLTQDLDYHLVRASMGDHVLLLRLSEVVAV